MVTITTSMTLPTKKQDVLTRRQERQVRMSLVRRQAELQELCKFHHGKECVMCEYTEEIAHIGRELDALAVKKRCNTLVVQELLEEVAEDGLTVDNYEVLTEMFETEEEQALMIGMALSDFRKWRIVNIEKVEYYSSKLTLEIYYELADQGFSNKKISEIVGISEKEMRNWRGANKALLEDYIPPKRKFKRLDVWRATNQDGDINCYMQWVQEQRHECVRAKRSGWCVKKVLSGYTEFDMYLKERMEVSAFNLKAVPQKTKKVVQRLQQHTQLRYEQLAFDI